MKSSTYLMLTVLVLCLVFNVNPATASQKDNEDGADRFVDRFTFGLEMSSVFQGTLKNSHNWKRVPGYPVKNDDMKLQFASDVMLEARLWQGATAFIKVEAGKGRGLSGHAGGFVIG